MAVMTAVSNDLSKNWACFASGRQIWRTLKACTLVMSDELDLTLAISSKKVVARSVSAGSLDMIAKIEYGNAAERRVVDNVSSRTVSRALCPS